MQTYTTQMDAARKGIVTALSSLTAIWISTGRRLPMAVHLL